MRKAPHFKGHYTFWRNKLIYLCFKFEIKKIYLWFVRTDVPQFLIKLHQVAYLSRSIKTRYNSDVSEANFGIHILLYVELLNSMLINLLTHFKTLSFKIIVSVRRPKKPIMHILVLKYWSNIRFDSHTSLDSKCDIWQSKRQIHIR